MTTTRMGSGLAFTPDKDLELFSQMAAKGRQLSGVAAGGHGWKFTEAPPEQAVFDMTHETHPSPGYFDIFEAAGWTLTLSVGSTHIFKAAPGTPPVHTSNESRRDELVHQRNQFARYSAATLAVLVVAALIVRAATWPDWVEVVILAASIIPVVYTAMPLAAYMVRLRKFRASS